MLKVLTWLGTLDRRWIFLVIGLSVWIPLWMGMAAIMPTTKIVQDLFDAVEGLPQGSTVLVSYDYGPGTAPENQPMGDALVRHCLEKRHKVILMTLWATGPPMIDQTIKSLFIGPTATDATARYGVDWINVGYKVGNQAVINSLVSSFGIFNYDAREGRPLSEYPIFEGIRSLSDIDLILCVGSGKPGLKEWVQFGGDQVNVMVGGGVTAVEAPLLYPYYPNQLDGLMGGLQGAAEYETALFGTYPELDPHGDLGLRAATNKMGPQTVAHLMIVMFVVVGNLAVVAGRMTKGS
jgi:hypothetical protein